MSSHDELDALRKALELSPDNGPLMRALGDAHVRAERLVDAEEWYRRALRQQDDDATRLALAECYLAQGKHDHAAVLADVLVERASPSGRAWLLHAQVKLAERDVERAARSFRSALELDPALANSDLARRLGMTSGADVDDTIVDGRVRVSSDDEGGPSVDDTDLERPKIKFADVGGMQSVKDEIAIKVIQPLAHPELFKAYGKSVGGGVLMYGPPGCGKTHLARATAGEIDARFLSIGIHDVLDMWIGKSERNLHGIFELARESTPCVLFFDEVDALGAKRSDMRGSAGRQVINQFLQELDGVQSSNDGVLVLAATNAPWHLDTAFRRPGRFDRVLFVPPPDEAARRAILELQLAGKPQESLDLAQIARKTPDFSGADLMGLVDLAVEEKLREALKSGAPSPLTTKDLLRAAKKARPSTKEWFGTARNHVLFANDGGLYDDVKDHLGL